MSLFTVRTLYATVRDCYTRKSSDETQFLGDVQIQSPNDVVLIERDDDLLLRNTEYFSLEYLIFLEPNLTRLTEISVILH